MGIFVRETGWPDFQQKRGERGLEKIGEKREEKRKEGEIVIKS